MRGWERSFGPLMAAGGFVVAMTAPLEVLYARRFGAGDLAVGLFVMSSAAGVLLVDVLGTQVVPRLEARTALTVGALLFGASSLVHGLTPTFVLLVPGRMAQGFAAAVLNGAALQAAVRVGTSRERALASLQFDLMLGGAIGAPVGGAVAALVPGTAGYRLAFVVCAVLCVAVAVATRLAVSPLPSSDPVRLAMPRVSGSRAMAPALALGMVGHYLRGGVVNIALPLVGEARGLSTFTIGVAIGLLSIAQLATLRVSGSLFERFSAARCLGVALALGIVAVTVLAALAGPSAFVLGAVLFGLVVAITLVGPPLLVMSASADATSGLAAYRIACGVGSLVGSTSVTVSAAAMGATGALSVIAGVLVGAVALVTRIARAT